ncbi:MAG: sulfatase-like hydrolase/transferase [Oscillospiraceae bacterium]|nr:sulfatase-like hydrolase/transferase [Oscillospiraceae bacterium]
MERETIETQIKKIRAAVNAMRSSRVWAFVSVGVLGVCITMLSLLLAAGKWGVPLFISYFRSPATLFLNILPCVLLIYALFFAFGRVWVAFSVSAVVVVFLAFLNYFKLDIRGSPLIAADIKNAGESAAVIGQFSIQWNLRLTFVLLCVAIGVVWCVFMIKARLLTANRKVRAAASLVSFALLFSSAVLCSADAVYDKAAAPYVFGETETSSPSEQLTSSVYKYVSRGFVYPFLRSMKPIPAITNTELNAGRRILAKYPAEDIPADRRVNVVSLMLESYCDLEAISDIKLIGDPYAEWRRLQAESITGNLVVNVFGGGTKNTERMFLTGFADEPTDYSYSVSFVDYFNEQGYATTGFHAGDGWYYDRETVHKQLGFGSYYFLESFEGSSREDSFFFPLVRSLYDSATADGGSVFMHNLTYQNHGGYKTDVNNGVGIVNPDAYTEEVYNMLSNYLVGIQDTNERLYAFADSLRDSPEPVVLVIYGDHRPWLGRGDIGYRALGIDVDDTSAEGFYNKYSAPYLIWANDAAKAIVGDIFYGDGGDFSPTFLMPKLFSVLGWGGDSFIKLERELMRTLTVINSATGYFAENGVVESSLSSAAQKLYADFIDAELYRKYKNKPF